MGFFIIWLNIWLINDLAETHNSLQTVNYISSIYTSNYLNNINCNDELF